MGWLEEQIQLSSGGSDSAMLTLTTDLITKKAMTSGGPAAGQWQWPMTSRELTIGQWRWAVAVGQWQWTDWRSEKWNTPRVCTVITLYYTDYVYIYIISWMWGLLSQILNQIGYKFVYVEKCQRKRITVITIHYISYVYELYYIVYVYMHLRYSKSAYCLIECLA